MLRKPRWRLGLASGCAGLLCLGLLPGASAKDPGDPPSKERVNHARERVQKTADDVDAIKDRLAAADERLQRLSMKAGKAVEKYNGARYQLHEAKRTARRAERRADKAAKRLHRREDQLAKAIVADFEGGGSLTNLSVLLENPDPNALLEKLNAYQVVTGVLQSDRERYEKAKADADVKEKRKDKALKAQETATQAAADAKNEAEAAVDKAQSAVSTIGDRKDELIHQLAEAKHISVALARKRQEALAAQAAAEAARQARIERRREQRRQERLEQQQQAATPDRPSRGGDHSMPKQDPPAASGARAAVRFAKAQIGEPYVWGAAGPDSWDCSGLTMEAWAAAGKSLSHWSVQQYYETTPVSFSDLKRGDLLFWGDTSDPDTIYHVAMYLGHGMMIHAPSPGENVQIVSMYYWILPNFYTRV